MTERTLVEEWKRGYDSGKQKAAESDNSELLQRLETARRMRNFNERAGKRYALAYYKGRVEAYMEELAHREGRMG